MRRLKTRASIECCFVKLARNHGEQSSRNRNEKYGRTRPREGFRDEPNERYETGFVLVLGNPVTVQECQKKQERYTTDTKHAGKY